MSYQRLQNLKHSLATSLALKPSWKVYFYLSGTTTPTDTYTTYARDVAHDNPVEADSGGILPDIYFDPAIAYKAVVKDENDVQQGDAIDPVNDSAPQRVVVNQAVAELAAGASRQDAFSVPGLAQGDACYVTLPYQWPGGLNCSPVIVATDVAYLQLHNPTGSPISMSAYDFVFEWTDYT